MAKAKALKISAISLGSRGVLPIFDLVNAAGADISPNPSPPSQLKSPSAPVVVGGQLAGLFRRHLLRCLGQVLDKVQGFLRLADSMAGRMGTQMISIDSGSAEWPVVTSSVAAGWAATEGGNVPEGAAYATTNRPMKPDHTLGTQMRITRKTLQQSGAAIEAAIRRDMQGAMAQSMDQAVFLGTGADGQPLGVVSGAATYGITTQAVDASATWGAFRTGVTAFMVANAAGSPAAVRALIRPELYDYMDGILVGTGGFKFEFDRLREALGTAKLGGLVSIDVVRPLQAYDSGGKARSLLAMVNAMAAAKEAGIDPAPLQQALDHKE